MLHALGMVAWWCNVALILGLCWLWMYDEHQM